MCPLAEFARFALKKEVNIVGLNKLVHGKLFAVSCETEFLTRCKLDIQKLINTTYFNCILKIEMQYKFWAVFSTAFNYYSRCNFKNILYQTIMIWIITTRTTDNLFLWCLSRCDRWRSSQNWEECGSCGICGFSEVH